MVFVNEKDKKRTIDYERNAIIVGAPSIGKSKTDFFELQWNGEKIRFGADLELQKQREGVWTANWTIDQVSIPLLWNEDKNKNQLRELRQILIEGLMVYGVLFGKDDPGSVHVDFAPHVKSLSLGNLTPIYH